ncbi:ATP-binding protein [Variovorax sp.]|uniref:ATP-binding protein n=1 Tax=Variovorax sp. TaxID=1871043 RepID=UPI002D40239B|nr:ATP-binding protein [Variovorax sp.]HYP85854.1 ATP-binding protein [Variovorax sp.]
MPTTSLPEALGTVQHFHLAGHNVLVFVAIALAALVVGMALFALWARSLRKQVRRREAAEAQLRHQLEFQRAMLDGMPHAIGVRDAQARLTYCNPAFEQLFDRPRDELIGRTIAQSPRADDPPEAWLQAEALHRSYLTLLATGTAINEDLDVTLNGVPRRLLHWAAPISLGGEAPREALVSGAVDMTERQQLMELIESARAKAEAANRAKTNFLAAMSHEIRTPMNAVTGVLELLLREGRLTPSDQAQAALARQSAGSLLGLIDDLLDISKIEAGAFEIVPRPAQLPAIVREVAHVFDSLARQKGLGIEVDVDPGLAAWHLVDPARFRQIVNNLVSNAIKYTDHGGVRVMLAGHGVDAGREAIELEVIDTGIGIAPEDAKHLFRPFFQAEAAGPRAVGGTGLGLPIVQRLCTRMGGDIWVDSQCGVGTSVHVALRLPVVDAPEDADASLPADEQARPAAHVATRGRYNVLVVDDHPANRLLLERQLAFLGYRSEWADDGATALARWRQGGIDAVITDLSMPVLDGHALTQAIRKAEHDAGLHRMPVLGCTAHVQERELRHALDVGMDECLLKPLGVDQLQEALGRHLPDADPPAASAGGGDPADGRAVDAAFDAQLLHDFSAGDTRMEIGFLQVLMQSNAADLEALARQVGQGDHAGAASTAHRIRGAARIVRADRVVDDCASLEAAARGEDAAASARALEALRRSLAEFDAAMARHLESYGTLAN